MKKFLLMTIVLTVLFIMPSRNVQASCETPVGGISRVLKLVDENSIELHIAYYSAIYNVDCYLVKAIMANESEYDITAYYRNDNGTHDSGLMQINSCNHEWLSEELGIKDFYEPSQNIKAGVYILSLLTAKYDSIHRVLMSYNMGETQTRKLWNKGIYSSRYSREVVERLKKIKEDSK